MCMSAPSGKPEAPCLSPLEPQGSRTMSNDGIRGGCPFTSAPSGGNEKASVRRTARCLRRAVPPRLQRAHSAAVSRTLRTLPSFRRARRVAAYLAADGELDLSPIIGDLRTRGRHCYLPVLRKARRGLLWFAEYRAGASLRPNRFGIPEPLFTTRTLVHPWALDLALLPLVAFDPSCRRLGMGGGFYDRSFAYRRHRRAWRRPLLIGVAHECQRVDRLPDSPWDIRLDAVVTEAGYYGCGSQWDDQLDPFTPANRR